MLAIGWGEAYSHLYTTSVRLTLELSLSCGRLTCITTVGSDTETSLYVRAVGFSTDWVRD